jgi:hypothetical protein
MPENCHIGGCCISKEAIFIFVMISAIFGCAAESDYLRNDAVDNIVTREPLSPPAPEVPCLTLKRFRVVSLKQLQEAVRQGFAKDVSPDAVQNMCGLTTIEGYYIDRKNKDLLIFGKVDSEMPPLLFDDFIVALRCAMKKYVADNVFTPPGCSIDPSVRMLKRLNAIEKQILSESSMSRLQAYKADYEEACARRQEVKVLGVPFNTHFASVLVKADYDMKRIVIGADAIDIPGVVDLYSLSSYGARQAVLSKKTMLRPTTILCRYWFKPAQFQFLEQKDWVMLDKCEIELLTEEQYLTEDDSVKGRGSADLYSVKVADSFTTYYTYIAQKRRIFHQLKELMRMYIVLEAMYVKDVHLDSGMNFGYFLKTYQLPKYFVSSSLLGKSRYIAETYTRETFDQTEQSILVFPICGGVNFEIFLRWDHFARAVNPRFAGVFRKMIHQKPQLKSLFWDVVLK